MRSIIALARTEGHVTPSDVRPLAWGLERMTPGLWAPGLLPGETLAEARARREAAADIWDDLLAEYDVTAEGVSA